MSTLNGGESEGGKRNWILRAYRQKNVRALPLATKGHRILNPPSVLEGHSKTVFLQRITVAITVCLIALRKWLGKTVTYRTFTAVYTNDRAKIQALAPIKKTTLPSPYPRHVRRDVAQKYFGNLGVFQ